MKKKTVCDVKNKECVVFSSRSFYEPSEFLPFLCVELHESEVVLPAVLELSPLPKGVWGVSE